jgi:hypothetical protein
MKLTLPQQPILSLDGILKNDQVLFSFGLFSMFEGKRLIESTFPLFCLNKKVEQKIQANSKGNCRLSKWLL